MDWDQTQGTHFIDIPNVGRYSISRKGSWYRAKLNGNPLAVATTQSLETMKNNIEHRIKTARDIAEGSFVLRRNTSPPVYFTDVSSEAWSAHLDRAKIMAAKQCAALFEQACKMFDDVEMILASSEKNNNHTINLKKMWLANWATPEDAEALNDDRDMTAFYLAHPVGVILSHLDESMIAHIQSKATREWVESCGDDADEDIADRYKNATWIETSWGKHVYALIHDEDKELLGVLVIREAEVA